jgi:hypothetical protein
MNDKLQLVTEKIKVRSGRKIRTIVLVTGYDMLTEYNLSIVEMCSHSFYFLDINNNFVDKNSKKNIDINCKIYTMSSESDKKVINESIIKMLNIYTMDYRFRNVLELDGLYDDFKCSYNLYSILSNYLFYNNNYSISNYRSFYSCCVHKIMNNNIYQNDGKIYYYCYARDKKSDKYIEFSYLDCCLLGFMNSLNSFNSQEMNMLIVCQLWNNLSKGSNYSLLTKRDALNKREYNLNVNGDVYELFKSKFDSLSKTFTPKQASMKNAVMQVSRYLRMSIKLNF